MKHIHKLLRRWRGRRAKYIPKRPHMEIARVLIWAASQKNANWCIMSIPKIAQLCRTMHGLRRCRNTIINHVNALEREGFVHRQRRITRERLETGGDVRTLYLLQPRLLHWASKHVTTAMKWAASYWRAREVDPALVHEARAKAQRQAARVSAPPLVQNLVQIWRDLFRSLLPAGP